MVKISSIGIWRGHGLGNWPVLLYTRSGLIRVIVANVRLAPSAFSHVHHRGGLRLCFRLTLLRSNDRLLIPLLDLLEAFLEHVAVPIVFGHGGKPLV